ncbi:MAG TPA: carbohydrate ABC transporter permease [Actinomycetes bacterium]|nr:carbohydrate ABC transporter permease [Actinomycetes bacterium]
MTTLGTTTSRTAPNPPARTVTRASRAPRRRRRGPGWLVYALLTAFLVGSAFPLYWQAIVGSHDTTAVFDSTPPLLPGGNFFSNAARVFDEVEFWKALVNSLIVASVITVSVVFFSTLAGFAFAKLRFRGRDALYLFVIATMAVPTQLGIIPLFILMSEYGWTGKLPAVIVPGMVTALGVFWMRQYLVQALPTELIEAARADGCNMIRVFWHVVLPAARPAAAVLAVFTFVMAWNDFLWPLIVLGPQNPTVQVAIDQLQSSFDTDFALVMTGTTLGTLPLLIVFVIFGRQIVAGIMQGAVKG